VASAGFNALVAFNARELAGLTGDDVLGAGAQELAEALDDRWDPDLRTWVDDGPTAATSGRIRTLDALLPALVTARPVPEVLAPLADPAAHGAPYGPTGVHRAEPTFAPSTYWRGSAWPQLSYLCWVATRSTVAGVGRARRRIGRVLRRSPGAVPAEVDGGRGRRLGVRRALGPRHRSRARGGAPELVHPGPGGRDLPVVLAPVVAPPAPSATGHLGGEVDHPRQHDQVTEGHHQPGAGHGEDVAEHGREIGRPLQPPASRELHPVELVGLDHPGGHERLGPHRHPLVERHRGEVGQQPDADHQEAGEMGVGGRPRRAGPPARRR
jgi:hypothetical protein